MKITRLKNKPLCPVCANILDAAGAMRGEASPRPGDFTLCLKCATILCFTAEMNLAVATEDEMAELTPAEYAAYARLADMIKKRGL